jgi:hypothetical protein
MAVSNYTQTFDVIAELSATVIEQKAWRATRIVSDKLKITVAQRMYRYKGLNKVRGKGDFAELVVTVGRLNYRERQIVKKARARKEPIGGTYVQFPPDKNWRSKKRK